MRPVTVIVAYLLFVFVGAAALSPAAYLAAQSLRIDIAEYPFHRFVNRLLLILALAGIWPLAKALGIRVKDLGLERRPDQWSLFARGLLWGGASLLIVATLTVHFDSRELDFDHTSGRWLKHVRTALLTAAVVGFLEELLFRGFLFASLRKNFDFWSAAMISSFIYALVHFFQRPANPPEIEWSSGFIILGRMMQGFVQFEMLIPGLLNLMVIGLLLAWVFENSRSLFFPYGLHAGFILCAKTFPFLTNPRPGEVSAFWGSDKLTDGWATLIVIGLLWMALSRTAQGGSVRSEKLCTAH